jgi:hypothetical protein
LSVTEAKVCQLDHGMRRIDICRLVERLGFHLQSDLISGLGFLSLAR